MYHVSMYMYTTLDKKMVSEINYSHALVFLIKLLK